MRTWIVGVVALCATAAWGIEELVPTDQPALDVITGYRIVQLEIQNDMDISDCRFNVTVQARRADGQCARDARGACVEVRHAWVAGDCTQVVKLINAGTGYPGGNTLQKLILNKMAQQELLPAGTVSGTPGIPDLPTPAPTPTGGLP